MKKLLYATITGIVLFTMSVTPTSSVDAALYQANIMKDRDKDGIASER